MIHSLDVARSSLLQTKGVARLTRSVKTVLQRPPVTQATTHSPGAVQTQADHGTESSPVVTAQIVGSTAPRRR
jgi:hypothetical protein